MKPIGLAAAIAALLSLTLEVRAEPSQPAVQVGDTYEITMIRKSSQQGDNGSSATSFDKDILVERVTAVRADGLELEYDLPKAATSDERRDNWRFPARVFRPRDGPLQLLNGPELDSRIDAWLKTAGWSRAACGRWIFTWNAFQIDCNPKAVLKTIEPFDLRFVQLEDGRSYQDPSARGPGALAKKTGGPDGATFAVEMEADPDVVRRARAESDVAVGEMMKKTVSLEAALSDHAKEAVSGTISTTFDTDSAGDVRLRTTVTKLQIKPPDGLSETRSVTETVERRRLIERPTRH